MGLRSSRKAVVAIYAEQDNDKSTNSAGPDDAEQSQAKPDQFRPLLIALGCSAAGALPIVAGYADPVLWMAASIVLWVTSTDFSSINNSLSGFESLKQISYPDGPIGPRAGERPAAGRSRSSPAGAELPDMAGL